eukprot:TRINITY_DN329_c0_g3_i1.p1 TRINITY_DN329_c0_g3~~TRINITY_DN329_c0_g3_i1.p1  ORF type:complete len:373 (-),score=95.19 TRINITY_DN329_c0_g3_i1:185-1303(-)
MSASSSSSSTSSFSSSFFSSSSSSSSSSTSSSSSFPSPLCPPQFFDIVESGIYRSNAFVSEHYSFIQTLGLKTCIFVAPELPPKQLRTFLDENKIQLKHQGLLSWKENNVVQYVNLCDELVKEALEFILDTTNHPVLIMCPSGVLETSGVVACLRRLQHWSFTAILDEYRRMSASKARYSYIQYFELFDVDLVSLPEHLPTWFAEHRKYLIQEEREHKAWLQTSSSSCSSSSCAMMFPSIKETNLKNDTKTHDKDKIEKADTKQAAKTSDQNQGADQAQIRVQQNKDSNKTKVEDFNKTTKQEKQIQQKEKNSRLEKDSETKNTLATSAVITIPPAECTTHTSWYYLSNQHALVSSNVVIDKKKSIVAEDDE